MTISYDATIILERKGNEKEPTMTWCVDLLKSGNFEIELGAKLFFDKPVYIIKEK